MNLTFWFLFLEASCALVTIYALIMDLIFPSSHHIGFSLFHIGLTLLSYYYFLFKIKKIWFPKLLLGSILLEKVPMLILSFFFSSGFKLLREFRDLSLNLSSVIIYQIRTFNPFFFLFLLSYLGS